MLIISVILYGFLQLWKAVNVLLLVSCSNISIVNQLLYLRQCWVRDRGGASTALHSTVFPREIASMSVGCMEGCLSPLALQA